jgi:hypothetical protein
VVKSEVLLVRFMVKSKGFPVNIMKACRGSRGVGPLILNLVTV